MLLALPFRMLWGGLRLGVRRLAPWGRTIGLCAGSVALSTFCWIGMVRTLAADSANRIPLETLSFGKLPEWIHPGVTEEAREAVRGAVEDPNLFNEDLTRQVAEALDGLDWVERVVEVGMERADPERDLPNRLSIALSVRMPVARITIPGRELLVDAEGVLLRAEVYRIDRAAIPAIVGLRGEFPLAGSRFEHEGVHAALYLLEALDRRRFAERYEGFRVTGADLARFENADRSDPDVELLTPGRIRLRFSWGVGPGRLPVSAQLDRLEEHLAMERSVLETSTPGYVPLTLPRDYVELRFDRPSYR